MNYQMLTERIQNIQDEIPAQKISHQEINDLIKMADDLDHINAKLELILAKGFLYYVESNTKKAYEYLSNARLLAERLNNMESLALVELRLGTFYINLGFYEQAFQLLLDALDKMTKYKSTRYLGVLNANIGTCLFRINMVDEALKFMTEGYKIEHASSNPVYKYFTSLNMTIMLMRSGQFEESVKYIEEAKQFLDAIPHNVAFGIPANISRLEAYRGNYDKSTAMMNDLVDEYFNESTQLHHYDHIIEWCAIMKNHDQLIKAKYAIEKTLSVISDQHSIPAAELKQYLGYIREEQGNYMESSSLYKEAMTIRRNIYEKNQQFMSEKSLRIIELSEQIDAITKETHRDSLTECYNRRALERLGRSFYDSNDNVHILMFDIDYFKQFNDYYGHIKGDQCLKSVTRAISELMPYDYQHLYRYGGDEFLLILPNSVDIDTFVSQMLNTIRTLKIPHNQSLATDIITITIGATSVNTKHTILRSAIDLADVNLYKAKYHARNCAFVNSKLIE